MADQEEDDMQMALKMSMQHEPPEPKRSKPRDNAAGPQAEESPEVKNRRFAAGIDGCGSGEADDGGEERCHRGSLGFKGWEECKGRRGWSASGAE
ncbi:unnamed protein product, partial [Ilex paraguariensis]